jgi:uncharacterized protein YnzC (UPF0291/DUF896 family)
MSHPFEAGYTPAQKAAQTRRNHRHGDLVDKKFLTGLTPEEEAELERLRVETAEYLRPFYAPILERIEQVGEGAGRAGLGGEGGTE